MKSGPRIVLPVLIVLACLMTSCGNPKWHDNFDRARRAAERSHREIYLLFTGDGWSQESIPFKERVTGTKEFSRLFSKEYVFVNINLSQEDLAPGGDEAKQHLAFMYDVKEYPSAFILSKEGYVLSKVPADSSVEDAQDYHDIIEELSDSIADVRACIKAVENNSGAEKVIAVEDLILSSDSGSSEIYRDLILQVPKMDPNNESGLVGKYRLLGAYYLSRSLISKHQPGVDLPFIEAAESGLLDGAQTQEAYYVAAYSLCSTGSQDYEKIEKYLELAFAADKDGNFSGRILETLDNIRKFIAHAEQEQQ